MPIDYQQIANIGPNYLAAQRMGMQNALIQRQVAQQDEQANALHTWGLNPEAPGSMNTLAAVDPQAAAQIQAMQANKQQIVASQQRMADEKSAIDLEDKKKQGLEVLSRMQYVLKSDKPALALKLGGKLSSGEDLIETLTQQGLIDPSDGLSDDEARQLAQAIHDRTSQQLGLGPDGKPILDTTKEGAEQRQRDALLAAAGASPADRVKASRIALGLEPRATNAAAVPEENDQTVENAAQMIAAGQIPMLTGMTLQKPWGQAVLARVKELNPGYQSGDNPARSATLKGFTSGKQGDTVRSLNVSIAHLDSLQSLLPGLKNGDVKAVNSIVNKYKEQTGSKATSAFEAARGIVGDEVTKAIVGGNMTQGDREEMKAQIDSAKSLPQLETVIETFQDLLAGQLGGLRRQYHEGTRLEDFDRFLSPEVVDRLGKIESAHAAKSGKPALPAGWKIEKE